MGWSAGKSVALALVGSTPILALISDETVGNSQFSEIHA